MTYSNQQAHDEALGAIRWRDARIAELESALVALVTAAANVETGRGVHNDRHPDSRIEGPVWVAMNNAFHEARNVLRQN